MKIIDGKVVVKKVNVQMVMVVVELVVQGI